MSKIRILFIDARGDLGGGSAHLAFLLEKLPQETFDIFVAAPLHHHHGQTYQNCARACFSIPYRRFTLKTFFELARWTENHGIHLIHSHGRGAGIYSRLLGLKLGLPILHTFHGISHDPASIRSLVGSQIERQLARWTTRFLHVSDSEQRYAQSLGFSDPARAMVIPNGIESSSFETPATSAALIRREIDVGDEDFLIGCVARFDLCKRHEDLIEALNRLVLKRPKLKLVLIGKGSHEEKIRRLIHEKALGSYVIFLGERSDVKSFYHTFDLFVLPSDHEGLPLTPLEALASGCPVVLTDVRGSCDIVEHEKTGLLVKPRDPRGLAEAIDRLIENPDFRNELAQNGKATVREKFSAKAMLESLTQLYASLVPQTKSRKVALVHDWLFHMRGGEKVLESIARLFPAAPIYTLFCNPQKLSPSLRAHLIRTSWLNHVPFVRSCYRYLLLLFPFLIRQWNLGRFDLVISSSHCIAKGARKGKNAVHVCYCHSPMRYVWGFEREYFGRYPLPIRLLIRGCIRFLKWWDLKTNAGVDHFIANSENVKKRIRAFYHRDAAVIHPPIQMPAKSDGPAGDFFLVVSAFVPYKRIDIAVEAFNRLKLPLVIIGAGPLLRPLKKQAGANIRFPGWLEDREVRHYYASCRALIFPTEEDFGMVPVEAMAFGKPVIAYGKGGALETVIPAHSSGDAKHATGLLFLEQNADALVQAVRTFERYTFDPELIKHHAEKFKTEVFENHFRTFIEKIRNTPKTP